MRSLKKLRGKLSLQKKSTFSFLEIKTWDIKHSKSVQNMNFLGCTNSKLMKKVLSSDKYYFITLQWLKVITVPPGIN